MGEVLSLLRQALTLDIQFGAHSLEALLWIAETVEEGVYEPQSLRRNADGIAFVLDNPPLRVGAFTSLTVFVNTERVPVERVQFRPGEGAPWRRAATIGTGAPLLLAPGDRTEFAIAGPFDPNDAAITLRLEFHTPAIPPLVWFEFTDRPTSGGPPA